MKLTGKTIFLFFMLFSSACKDYSKADRIFVSTPNQLDEKAVPLAAFFIDSILYQDHPKLASVSTKNFSYELAYLKEEAKVLVKSKSSINENELEYKIELKYTGKDFERSKFNISEEDIYPYLNSSMTLNDQLIDLTDIHFTNAPSRKIYPAGFWHPSIETAAMKYYQLAEQEIFLLNGVNLYCNGTHCNSYQVYILVKEAAFLAVHVLDFDGLFPYDFEHIHLVDIGQDGVAEIFVPKDGVSEIKTAEDFDIYSIKRDGLLKH